MTRKTNPTATPSDAVLVALGDRTRTRGQDLAREAAAYLETARARLGVRS